MVSPWAFAPTLCKYLVLVQRGLLRACPTWLKLSEGPGAPPQPKVPETNANLATSAHLGPTWEKLPEGPGD